MPIDRIFYDLDDTLVKDDIQEFVEQTCAKYGAQWEVSGSELRAKLLHEGAAMCAASPYRRWMKAVGNLSVDENLCSPFGGGTRENPPPEGVGHWGADMQLEACLSALEKVGIRDNGKAYELANALREERYEFHTLLPHAGDVVRNARLNMQRLLLTNGYSYPQRRKLKKTGLHEVFDPKLVVISGEVGIAKPDPHIAEIALQRCGAHTKNAAHTLFLGNSLQSDMALGKKVGMQTVWLNDGQTMNLNHSAFDHVITDLTQFPELVDTLRNQ